MLLYCTLYYVQYSVLNTTVPCTSLHTTTSRVQGDISPGPSVVSPSVTRGGTLQAPLLEDSLALARVVVTWVPHLSNYLPAMGPDNVIPVMIIIQCRPWEPANPTSPSERAQGWRCDGQLQGDHNLGTNDTTVHM